MLLRKSLKTGGKSVIYLYLATNKDKFFQHNTIWATAASFAKYNNVITEKLTMVRDISLNFQISLSLHDKK